MADIGIDRALATIGIQTLGAVLQCQQPKLIVAVTVNLRQIRVIVAQKHSTPAVEGCHRQASLEQTFPVRSLGPNRLTVQ
jgi:hypothetical protein